ncbi:prepilin-type N-terminal cleavage/methylation domain-containing protein [Neobacillus niacini]|uniref:prepilin-type N-terminal cleavage/methylation domain-containing protein n=1 Tax=Neobacillus niacini TaxID=86668 RepID=UPI002FFDF83D
MVESLKLKAKDQKGFTLIELLAVIVILGIIAAIAIPAIGNVISKSKDDAKVAEAISIIDAARLAQLDLNLSKTEDAANLAKGITVNRVSATDDTITTIVWGKTSALDPLNDYLSKVQAATYTVTYTEATKSYSISGHPAASVKGVDVATAGGTASDGTLLEEDLANAAR